MAPATRPRQSRSGLLRALRASGWMPAHGFRISVLRGLADVVAGTRARYVEAFELLTGLAFDDYLADPQLVLR